MSSPAHHPRLLDILDAIDAVRAEVEGVSLDMFESDRRRRWVVERGIEIISEASRHLPATLKSRHPDIPWRRIAGIGNILRHEYSAIASDVLWAVANDELLPLEIVCRAEHDALPPSDNP